MINGNKHGGQYHLMGKKIAYSRLVWSVGLSLSATSCKWMLQKQKCVNASSSNKSWISNLSPIEWYYPPCLYPFDRVPVSLFQECWKLWRLNQYCSLKKFQILYHWSQTMATKCCHCHCCCCYCYCFLHSNCNPHHHYFCWQAHPVMQKNIWLSWYPAGN